MNKLAVALAFLVGLVVTAAVADSADAGKKPKVLKIKKAPKLKKGMTVTVKDEMTMQLTIKAGKKDIPFKMAKQAAFTVTFLATDGTRPTKVKVVYGALVETEDVAGKVENKVDGRANNTYEADATAELQDGVCSENWKIVSSGADVTDEKLLKDLRKEHDGMFRGVPIRAFLVGRSMTVGETVTLGDAEFDAIFPTDDTDSTIKTFTVTLVGIKGNIASYSFAALFDLIDPDTKSPLTIDATGAFTVDTKKVLPLSLSVEGTVTGSMQQGKQTMTMTGTMTALKAYKYK